MLTDAEIGAADRRGDQKGTAGRRRVKHGDVMHRELAAATWTFAANSEVFPDGSVAVAERY